MYIGLHVHCIHASYIHVGLHTCMQNDEGDEKQWSDKDVDRRGQLAKVIVWRGEYWAKCQSHIVYDQKNQKRVSTAGAESIPHKVIQLNRSVKPSHYTTSILL